MMKLLKISTLLLFVAIFTGCSQKEAPVNKDSAVMDKLQVELKNETTKK